MQYLFDVQGAAGAITLAFNPQSNTLAGAGAVPVPLLDKGDGGRQLHICIILGTGCNYRCSYCCQSGIKDASPSPLDTDAFLRLMHGWDYSGYDSAHIMFFGGEPFLYFERMKELAAGLGDLLPSVTMGLCTNGSLFTEGHVRWLHDSRVGLGFSYDGPGQAARHRDDVLAPGSFALEALRDGLRNHGWVLNPVFHRGNPLLSGYIRFMDERLGMDGWSMGDIQSLMVTDTSSRAWALADGDLQAFTEDALAGIFRNEAEPYLHIYEKAARAFLNSLGKTAGGFGGCLNTLPSPPTLNVDLSGRLWACQSCVGIEKDGLGGSLCAGSLSGGRRPVQLRVLEQRRGACMACVLRMFCGGGCPLTPAEYDGLNCRIQFHKWFPALALAVYRLTGGQLTGIRRKDV